MAVRPRWCANLGDVLRRVVALTFVAAVMACGGEPRAARSTSEAPPDTTDTVPITFAVWVHDVRAVCREFVPQVDAAVAALEEPTSRETLIPYLDALIPINERYISAFIGIEVPAEHGEEIEHLYDLFKDRGRVLTVARNAASYRDVWGMDAAVNQLEASGDELGALFGVFDLPECAGVVEA
jgi:hypothetical protein